MDISIIHISKPPETHRKSDVLDLIFRGNLAEHVQATRNNYRKTYASDPIFGILCGVAFVSVRSFFPTIQSTTVLRFEPVPNDVAKRLI